MKIFNKKKLLICTLLMSAVLILAAGCNEDHTKGTPWDKTGQSDTPTSNETVTPAASGKNEPDAVSDPSKDTNKSDKTDSAEQDKQTDNNKQPDTSISDETTPSPTEVITDITDVPDTELTSTPEAVTSAPDSADKGLDRNECWDKTFLIWLPMFTAGKLDNIDHAGTKSSGFTNVSIENYSEDAIAFIASKDNSWEVRVTFTGQSLVLGSGFNDGGADDEDKTDSLYSTTMLQYVPRFSKGSYLSSESRSDSSMYTGIVYTDVTRDDALSYIEDVKQKGYVYVEDEGESDGSLWYIAINDERFECHVEFSGQELKIGCGYMEDD